MRLTRFTHACIRIESDDSVLVVDPGIWSEPRALEGASAVLITHEHIDHIDELRLAGSGVSTFAPMGSDLARAPHKEVEVGSTMSIAGFAVAVVGGEHARVVPAQRPRVNVGYIIDDALYHPGDSLHVPDSPIDTLFVPLHASWLKTYEAIEFVNRVAPRQAIGIHDAQLNERGLEAVNGWLGEECGDIYRWLAPGTTIKLDER